MKTIVLLSGGLDSAVLAALALTQGEVAAVSFDYGQLHRAELDCAETLARHLGIEMYTCAMPWFTNLGQSTLTGTSKLFWGADTVVPGRNVAFIAAAIHYAAALKAERIWLGVTQSDNEVYPDCRPGFIVEMNRAVKAATEGAVRVEAPLIAMQKRDVVRLGAELGVPFGLTRSCYRSGPGHCWMEDCGSCRERIRAFAEAGLTDPAKQTNDIRSTAPTEYGWSRR
jgi:7-cyano-7-deazaguanine synthase